MVLHLRLKGLHLSGQLCLGLHQIDLRQKLIAVEHFAYMRTYSFGHLRQYAYNFVAFVAFKLPDSVVGLHHFGRFYEHRAARCTFVVHNTVYLSFQRGRNGNHQTAVAHGGGDVLFNNALGLCRTQNAAEDARNGAFHACQLAANLCQFGRRRVAHVSEFVNNLVNLLH